MAYLETLLPKGGSAGKVFDFKMADNVNKAPVSKKVKKEWLEEDIEKLVTLWSEEKVLYRFFSRFFPPFFFHGYEYSAD